MPPPAPSAQLPTKVQSVNRPSFAPPPEEVAVLPEGHPLLARRVLELADFSGLPFVSLAPQDSYRRQIDALFAARGVTRALLVETASAVSVAALVRQGLGVSVINPLTALAFEGSGLAWRRLAVAIPFKLGLIRPLWRASNPLADRLAVEIGAVARELQAKLAR